MAITVCDRYGLVLAVSLGPTPERQAKPALEGPRQPTLRRLLAPVGVGRYAWCRCVQRPELVRQDQSETPHTDHTVRPCTSHMVNTRAGSEARSSAPRTVASGLALRTGVLPVVTRLPRVAG
jgi:hypothetical protein